mmetsp:Transcript_5003/g.7339  ORF Transcript_5003/g.7339 Transcript_5003/m.7339 type:complete len:146 (-) Transcript_5003:287-724(-)
MLSLKVLSPSKKSITSLTVLSTMPGSCSIEYTMMKMKGDSNKRRIASTASLMLMAKTSGFLEDDDEDDDPLSVVDVDGVGTFERDDADADRDDVDVRRDDMDDDREDATEDNSQRYRLSGATKGADPDEKDAASTSTMFFIPAST